MKKDGFTLVELLVVIAIIAVLSIIIVPSVISINKNINQRLLSEKIEQIESAAVLYANNNEEIFNGTDEVRVYVYELVNSNYLTIDVKVDGSKCKKTDDQSEKGCVINPTKSGSSASMNNDYVLLRKEGAGSSAKYYNTADPYDPTTISNVTLVKAVCTNLENGTFVGKSKGNKTCKCEVSNNQIKLIEIPSKAEVQACIISGDNVNNYLKYGDTKANWRVIGLYKGVDSTSNIVAKMITIDPV